MEYINPLCFQYRAFCFNGSINRHPITLSIVFVSLLKQKKKKQIQRPFLFCSDFHEQNKLYTIKRSLYETSTKEDNLILLRINVKGSAGTINTVWNKNRRHWVSITAERKVFFSPLQGPARSWCPQFLIWATWPKVYHSHQESKWKYTSTSTCTLRAKCFNPLKPELNSICYLLALLAHHFLHVSRIRVKSLTFRRLMSYIYIWSTHSWCF